MTAVILQLAVAVLTLTFGILSLFAARVEGGEPHAARAWEFTGFAFSLLAANSLIHSTAAAFAFARGPGSAAWNTFLEWTAVGNYSRAALVLAFGLLLLLQMLRRTAPSNVLAATGGLLLAMIVGGILGNKEGQFEASVHFGRVAMLSTAEMVILLVALFAAFVKQRMDRLLWACLVLYALKQALSVAWEAGYGSFGVVGGFCPSCASGKFMSALIGGVMVALAVVRLIQGRRGIPVPPLLEPLPRARPTFVEH